MKTIKKDKKTILIVSCVAGVAVLGVVLFLIYNKRKQKSINTPKISGDEPLVSPDQSKPVANQSKPLSNIAFDQNKERKAKSDQLKLWRQDVEKKLSGMEWGTADYVKLQNEGRYYSAELSKLGWSTVFQDGVLTFIPRAMGDKKTNFANNIVKRYK